MNYCRNPSIEKTILNRHSSTNQFATQLNCNKKINVTIHLSYCQNTIHLVIEYTLCLFINMLQCILATKMSLTAKNYVFNEIKIKYRKPVEHTAVHGTKNLQHEHYHLIQPP